MPDAPATYLPEPKMPTHTRRDSVIAPFRREVIHMVVPTRRMNGYWRIIGCNYQKTLKVGDGR